MNLAACCTPCSCCHVSMEMREEQDVAHSDYLGGWQHRQLVNTWSSTPPQHIRLSPADPHAHCLLHSLPFWSRYHANRTPGRARWQQPECEYVRQAQRRPQQVCQLQCFGGKPVAPTTLCHCCCSSICSDKTRTETQMVEGRKNTK